MWPAVFLERFLFIQFPMMYLEIQVLLRNYGEDEFVVEPGMRIAQGVIAKVERVEWEESDDLSETKRSHGGFGSTGLK